MQRWLMMIVMVLLLLIAEAAPLSDGRSSPLYPSPFANSSPQVPRLLLVAGCTGAGKSTLAMSIALQQGFMRCVSTDTIRLVLRSVLTDPALHPALHRSSYSGQGPPVEQWLQCASSLQPSIEAVVADSLQRKTSLVLEGVHVQPNNDLLQAWRARGGQGLGCLLTIRDEDLHRNLILQRGKMMTKAAEEQVRSFRRIRAIQEAMVQTARAHNWLVMEQDVETDPLQRIAEAFH